MAIMDSLSVPEFLMISERAYVPLIEKIKIFSMTAMNQLEVEVNFLTTSLINRYFYKWQKSGC
jgi:hypothetical protein